MKINICRLSALRRFLGKYRMTHEYKPLKLTNLTKLSKFHNHRTSEQHTPISCQKAVDAATIKRLQRTPFWAAHPNFLLEVVRCGLGKKLVRMDSAWCTFHSSQ